MRSQSAWSLSIARLVTRTTPGGGAREAGAARRGRSHQCGDRQAPRDEHQGRGSMARSVPGASRGGLEDQARSVARAVFPRNGSRRSRRSRASCRRIVAFRCHDSVALSCTGLSWSVASGTRRRRRSAGWLAEDAIKPWQCRPWILPARPRLPPKRGSPGIDVGSVRAGFGV